MNGPNCIEAQMCRADFYLKLAEALEKSGGCSHPHTIERYQNLRLSDFVDIVAQNGLRITFNKEWHINPSDLPKPTNP